MDGSAAGPAAAEDARLAVAALLVMAARADEAYQENERSVIEDVLAEHYRLTRDQARTLRTDAEAAEAEAVDLYRFTRAVRDAIPIDERMFILEALWTVILTDAHRDPLEDTLMRQIADRLGLSAMDSALARQRVARD